MSEIIAILGILSPTLTPCTLNQLIIIVDAMLAMTGRATNYLQGEGVVYTRQEFFEQHTEGGYCFVYALNYHQIIPMYQL